MSFEEENHDQNWIRLSQLVEGDSRDGLPGSDENASPPEQTLRTKEQRAAERDRLLEALLEPEESSGDENETKNDQEPPVERLPKLPPGVEPKPPAPFREKHHHDRPDPNDPNSRKRPRKSYTDMEKRLVIEADARGGRQERLRMADMLGMKAKTADNLISKARYSENAAMDKRHDAASNVGRHSKQHPWHLECLTRWLHVNSTLTLKQLKMRLNREILRKLLIKHQVEITEDEKQVDGTLNATKYLEENPEVAKEYKDEEVHSLVTISNWLNGICYTKKHVVTEKTTVNSPSAMQKRLEFAKVMRDSLADDKFFFVFEDEMPFYMTLHRAQGRALKGKRAVVKVPPVGEMNFRTQVAMAVNPSLGLIYGAQYPPKKSRVVKKDGKLSTNAYRANWNKEQFKDYTNTLLQKLFERRSEISGKICIILIDGAPEHGSESGLATLFRELPNYRQLKDFLTSSKGDLRVLRLPPNSPQINLCEYYNRTLRTKANALRADLEINDMMLQEAERGHKMEVRLSCLENILDKCLKEVAQAHAQTGSVVRMMKFLEKIIEQKGYLDMTEPM